MREVYVVLRQIDDSMPAEVVGVYDNADSANLAADCKGCWVTLAEFWEMLSAK